MENGLPTSEPLAPLIPEPVVEPVPSPPAPKRAESEFTLRRFVESAILFGTIVLVLRAIALEPYGVPTGSMATTMIGNHKECNCPRCGFRVVVGSGNGGKAEAGAAERAYATAWCPNCGQSNLQMNRCREVVGDRLLVDKNVFEFRRPRRWEVAVFRNPSDLSKPYVKRVVALPGESVQIRGGDVYINDQLERKSLDESRAMRVLIFDQSYHPPQGWKQRWLLGAADEMPPELTGPKSAATADEHLDGGLLVWQASDPEGHPNWITYRHWLLDEGREEPIRDWFAYNGAALQQELREVRDFSVEFEVEVGSGTGALLLKLFDGQTRVMAEIPVVASGGSPRAIRLFGIDRAPIGHAWAYLKAGNVHRIEFAIVDRRVMLAIDGNEAIPAVDLPDAPMRRGISRPVSIGVRGPAVTIRGFRLHRDVHYTTGGGRNGIHEAWPLGPDEYFLLGDNSANSEDSRFWLRPGIPLENFLGKPLLLHQPSRWSNLGSWETQSIDWRRIRWIK